jgi:methylenetetrahydrofolate dehydrogenase (NADP+)/methenyltetrahydrofolate cyclohydrolase
MTAALRVLRGAEVAEAINTRTAELAEGLRARGVEPLLAIVRVGERDDALSYERGTLRRAEGVGVAVRTLVLSETVSQDGLLEAMEGLNSDERVHGVLLLRPFPPHIDDNAIRNALAGGKDIDGITDSSVTGVLTGVSTGFAPCTAQACMEILDYYNIACAGKHAVVVGRSLVVGKPVALMLLNRNATVSVAHSRSVGLPALTQGADIIIACTGQPQMLGADWFSPEQTVIDVGINFTADGLLVGDVDYDAAAGIVGAITPVPGGVGVVTTAVLMRHVVEAAE